jgi:ribosomal protein L15E
MPKRTERNVAVAKSELSPDEAEKVIAEQGALVQAADTNVRNSYWTLGDAATRYKEVCRLHRGCVVSDAQISEVLKLHTCGQRLNQVRNTAEYYPEELRE